MWVKARGQPIISNIALEIDASSEKSPGDDSSESSDSGLELGQLVEVSFVLLAGPYQSCQVFCLQCV